MGGHDLIVQRDKRAGWALNEIANWIASERAGRVAIVWCEVVANRSAAFMKRVQKRVFAFTYLSYGSFTNTFSVTPLPSSSSL